ncbi:MAG: sulfite exporter TauE/SafE family protein, partial [Acidobacteriota bacterium]|nr:sulfite exporter TauE/SafE family protein [Acidobacteriota bacterium]
MLLILLVGVLAGAFGAMMGLGGAILLIPVLTGFFDLPIRAASGVGIVCVIATSCGSSVSYLHKGLTHSRLAMTLETATVAGALAGGLTAMWLSPRWLAVTFGCVLLYTLYCMYRFSGSARDIRPTGMLDTEYVDPNSGETVVYGVRRLWSGMWLSFIAGNISGLLGIGGGIVKTPVMNLVMGVPLRAAIAT